METKICSKCLIEKELGSFANSKCKAGKVQSWCRVCQKENAAERRKRNFDFVQSVKKKSSCILCGENHPATLDFHHRDPKEKEHTVSTMCSSGWSLKRLQAEVDKCDVLCANCHRILHYQQKINAAIS